MELSEFETIVRDAIAGVPRRFREKLQNVAFVIEPEHRPVKRGEDGIYRRGTLLGLYQGIPYGQRGPWYSGVLPDKITLFQDTIEAYAGGDDHTIERVVQDTVHHEIAHYFGMNEAEVRTWEKKRRHS